jgi:hypothetical protein
MEDVFKKALGVEGPWFEIKGVKIKGVKNKRSQKIKGVRVNLNRNSALML